MKDNMKHKKKRDLTRFSLLALLFLLFGLSGRPAHAHFLWAQLTADTPPRFRLAFAEQAGEKTLPDLLKRVKPDSVQTANGKTLTLTATGDSLEAVTPAGTGAASASQLWGVLDRENGKNVFLLQYYAKAAATSKAAAQKANLPVELFARQEGADCVATVTRDAKPEAGAEVIVTIPGDDKPQELKTDANGEVRFPLSGAGLCSLRARVIENAGGTYAGKTYTSKRSYSTLTFPLSPASDTTPVQSKGTADDATRNIPKADSAAYALLKAAHDRRATFGNAFPGLAANLVFNDNGVETTGTLTYSPEDGVKMQIDGLSKEAQPWLEDQVSSLLAHRRGGDFAKGDGRNPITFTPDDHSPLGRQVALHDGLQSFYRVRGNQVTEVTRTMGGERFTITVLETTPVDGGKYLPRHFAVTYFDAKTGGILRAQSFTDDHRKVDSEWVPTSRRVITAENGQFTTRVIELRNLRLMAASTTPRGTAVR